jgi:hypothetical protein
MARNGESTLQPGLGARYFLSFSPSLNLNVRMVKTRWPAEMGKRDSASSLELRRIVVGHGLEWISEEKYRAGGMSALQQQIHSSL